MSGVATLITVVATYAAERATEKPARSFTTTDATTLPAERLERVVFVLDGLGRLSADDRQRVLTQVKAAVAAMKPPQTYNIVLTRDQSETTFKPNRLLSATVTHYKQLEDWLLIPPPIGGTDLRPGLDVAFGLVPEAIYLLTDGRPTGGPAALAKLADDTAHRFVKKKSAVALRITLVASTDAAEPEAGTADALRRLASAAGGSLVSVRATDLQSGNGLPESRKD